MLTVGSQSNIKNGLTTQLTYDVANAEKTSNQMWKWAFGNICMQTQGFQLPVSELQPGRSDVIHHHLFKSPR